MPDMNHPERLISWLAGCFILIFSAIGRTAPPAGTTVLSLDGTWKVAIDPNNQGRDGGWFRGAPRPDCRDVSVPGIIQEPFPAYHGVAWYFRDVDAPPNVHRGGRYLLRFWAVDYLADVWVNGVYLGGHEGGETPFVLDATSAIKPGAGNRVAVRVLNPSNDRIDGIVLGETPHRNKVVSYSAGNSFDHGGIVDSVELLICPAVRIADVYARPDPKTGIIRIHVRIDNASNASANGEIQFTVAPASAGTTLAASSVRRAIGAGESELDSELKVPDFGLWQSNDPQLYRVSVRVSTSSSPDDPDEFDESSVRVGFRDFRFEGGYFRLNGKRVLLRCSHTGNHLPIGQQVPLDPGLIRKDLLYVKSMGFNTIRFIAGLATRYQLDLCDEIGLMVYEESNASWVLGNSPKMPERFDRSVREMILRDRNHPSVVAWGLLNETEDGPVSQHALRSLPLVRSVDDDRLVLFSSGRWDLHSRSAGPAADSVLDIWRSPGAPDPNITFNPRATPFTASFGVTWPSHQLALHPGPEGQFSVARFTAPSAGDFKIDAAFTGLATPPATTDIHIVRGENELFSSSLNLEGHGNSANYHGRITLARGDALDFIVGWGNANYGSDTTGLTASIKSDSGQWDVSADFSESTNPGGAWSFGVMKPAPKPDPRTFTLYSETGPKHEPGKVAAITAPMPGTLANPGVSEWQDVLEDLHTYPRWPHQAGTIDALRNEGHGPLFVSEYGVGSALDLVRVVDLFEEAGYGQAEDARFYRALRDRFLGDWELWKLADTFGRPQDYFREALARMAFRRATGLNALRSNPNLVGYSLTGTVDQGMSGEGLFTTFREFKPGALDAVADGLAPLRWCLFAEPVQLYRGGKVHIEAVLADEDVLAAGTYPVRVQVLGPDHRAVYEKIVSLSVAAHRTSATRDVVESPFAKSILNDTFAVDGPPGEYRLVASFDHGAAAAGGAAVFHVADRSEMPAVSAEITLWGDDAGLSQWLKDAGIQTRLFSAGSEPATRETILASRTPPAPGGADAFDALYRRVGRGSTVVFLSPNIFARQNDPLGWFPLAQKGTLVALSSWLYVRDDWAKNHPIFAGLPSDGFLDETFYRDLIPDRVFSGQDAPDEVVAGACNASADYSSGLTLAVRRLGEGRFITNTLLIRDNLGPNPAAERLLRNLLNFASRDAGKPPAELPKDFEDKLKQAIHP